MRFKKIRRWLRDLTDLHHNKIFTSDSSRVEGFCRERMSRCHIKMSGNSKLILGKDVLLDRVRFQIGSDSCISIASGSVLKDVDICVWGGSTVRLGERCDIRRFRFVVESGNVEIGHDNFLSSGDKTELPCINMCQGTLISGDHNSLKGSAWIRFGGILEIGRYNCINDGSELRCDESIRVGSFNMISYDCDIWDTNTHAEYTLEEKKVAFAGSFPRIGYETKKPKTRPVVIGDGNWIGKNACILKGTVIGNNVTVGTRAIATNITLKDGVTLVSSKGTILQPV